MNDGMQLVSARKRQKALPRRRGRAFLSVFPDKCPGLTQPSIMMVFRSGTFAASFFGIIRCSTPFS